MRVLRIFAPQPVLWAIPSAFLTGASAAAGLAAINSVGNLGGFLGPSIVGTAIELTGSRGGPVLRHVVNILGRTRLCTPALPLPGVPRC